MWFALHSPNVNEEQVKGDLILRTCSADRTAMRAHINYALVVTCERIASRRGVVIVIGCWLGCWFLRLLFLLM